MPKYNPFVTPKNVSKVDIPEDIKDKMTIMEDRKKKL